jgi:hypothetical protein
MFYIIKNILIIFSFIIDYIKLVKIFAFFPDYLYNVGSAYGSVIICTEPAPDPALSINKQNKK